MWKATATLDQNSIKDTIAKKQDDDLEDWDSDPNFVNAVSEKDQRWGRQETCPKEPVNQGQEPIAMEGECKLITISLHKCLFSSSTN